MSCLWGILGRFWNFVKNFFEGHTSPPPRSAFAPPAPLCNEPGFFDRFTNLLCFNLLQYRNTCLSVATSVKISVFGGYFWRGGFVYILRKWIFYFTAISFCFIQICCVSFPLDSLVNVPHYHVIKLSRWLRLQLEDLPRYLRFVCRPAVRTELLCGWRFCSCWGVHRRPPTGVVNTFKLTC